MTVSNIIDQLGGAKAVAEYTGWPFNTVDTWRRKGFVPEWRRATLLRMALERGIPLSTADFPNERPQQEAA